MICAGSAGGHTPAFGKHSLKVCSPLKRIKEGLWPPVAGAAHSSKSKEIRVRDKLKGDLIKEHLKRRNTRKRLVFFVFFDVNNREMRVGTCDSTYLACLHVF